MRLLLTLFLFLPLAASGAPVLELPGPSRSQADAVAGELMAELLIPARVIHRGYHIANGRIYHLDKVSIHLVTDSTPIEVTQAAAGFLGFLCRQNRDTAQILIRSIDTVPVDGKTFLFLEFAIIPR